MKCDLPERKALTIDCKQQAVRAVRFSVDSQYCLTCGGDKTVKLWNPFRSLFLKAYIGHGHEVLDAHSSGDNSHLCSGGLDKSVVLFDVESGKILRKFREHAGTVNCVLFNEESTVILSGSLDSTVKAWDIRSRGHKPIQIMDEATDSVTCLDVSDHEILTGSADGQVRLYDLRLGRLLTDYLGKTVCSVHFTRDGQCSLVSCQDSTVKLMDKDTGEMLNEFVGHKNSQYKVDSCLNNEDSHVVSGSEDGQVYFWDLVEAKLIRQLIHDTSRPVHSLSHHHSKPYLLTACADKIHLWCSKQEALDNL